MPLVSEKTPQRVLKTHAGIIIRFILIAISYLVTELLKTKTKLRYVRLQSVMENQWITQAPFINIKGKYFAVSITGDSL